MQELSKGELERLIQPAFPDATVNSSEFARGGLANTNIRVELSGRTNPVLLRIFDRAPEEAAKERRIFELLRDVVPSPEIFYFGTDSEIIGPYMIMEFISGERLELVANNVERSELLAIGRAVGESLATVHSIKFPRYGFFDQNLNVSDKLDMGAHGLAQYARKCLIDDIGGSRLGANLSEEILDFIEREGKILDQWTGEPCLTHSDFGGSNILVSKRDGNWKVAAILDWEFAFSGTPFFDFGNLLRKPLGSISGFERAVYDGYTTNGGTLPDEWRKMSLMTDLTAWLDFLTRPTAGDQLIADARQTIMETMTQWHVCNNP